MALQINALPTPPSRQTPSTFSADMDAFLGALPTFRNDANTLATEVESNAATAETAAATATSKAADAVAAASAAESAANATKWISGFSYTEGDVAWSPVDYQTYRRKTTGAGTVDPSADAINWQMVPEVTIYTPPPEPKILASLTGPTLFNNPGFLRAAVLDADREIVVYGPHPTGVSAVVYNNKTKLFGTPVLVRSAYTPLASINVLPDGRVVVVSFPPASTTMEAVALTIIGTSIVVGTAGTATLAANISAIYNTVLCGTSVVVSYITSAPRCELRAVDCSGATPAIGSAIAAPVADSTGRVMYIRDSVVCWLTTPATATVYATPYTVSGSTLTVGTGASLNISNSQSSFREAQFPTSRNIVAYYYPNKVVITKVVGTTAYMVSANTPGADHYGATSMAIDDANNRLLSTALNQLIFLRDNNGTPVVEYIRAHTAISTACLYYLSANKFLFVGLETGGGSLEIQLLDTTGGSQAYTLLGRVQRGTSVGSPSQALALVSSDGTYYQLLTQQSAPRGAVIVNPDEPIRIVDNIPITNISTTPMQRSEFCNMGYSPYIINPGEDAAWGYSYSSALLAQYAIHRIGVA